MEACWMASTADGPLTRAARHTAGSGTTDSWLDRMTALEGTLQELQDQRRGLEQRERLMRVRLRLWQGAVGALLLAGLLLAPTRHVTAQGQHNGLAAQVAALQAQIDSLQTALNKEIAARQAAEAALQNQIHDEGAARSRGD